MLKYIYIYIYIYWIHTDAMIKTLEGLLYTNITSHFIAMVRKGFVGFYCERELETEHNCNILTPKLMAVNVVSSRSSDAQPEVQRPLCWVMAFFTASYQHLLRTSTHQGPKAPSAWCGFPYHISTPIGCNSTGIRTQLRYIIVRLPLDLWNRMFNRHQTEITIMQFRGHSLPVHHCSGTVGPSPCPILSALIRPRDLFRLLAIGMCHFLPVHHLGIAFLGRVEGQNTTYFLYNKRRKIYLVEHHYTNRFYMCIPGFCFKNIIPSRYD